MRVPSLGEILGEHGSAFPARQKIYKELNKPEHLNAPVLLYFANFEQSPRNMIDKTDIVPIESLLQNLLKKSKLKGKAPKFHKLILLMHSPGGFIDVAEEILQLIRSYCESLEIVALYSLKSAATLLAFGTDHLYMGHLSELGPVDPQIFTYKGPVSAQSYVDFYRAMKDLSSKQQLTKADIALLHNLDPGFLEQMMKFVRRTTTFSEKELKDHLMNGKGEKAIQGVIKDLGDPKYSLSHGKTVGPDKCVELFGSDKVTVFERDHSTWNKLWELFMRADTYVRFSNLVKLYETNIESIYIKAR